MTQGGVWKLRKLLGEPIKVYDADGKGPEGRFLRFQVELDVRRPLMRGTLPQMAKEQKFIRFKYERLMHFCYKCGCLGHTDKDCKVPWKSGTPTPYDEDLRASPMKSHTKVMSGEGRGGAHRMAATSSTFSSTVNDRRRLEESHVTVDRGLVSGVQQKLMLDGSGREGRVDEWGLGARQKGVEIREAPALIRIDNVISDQVKQTGES